jgi:hypothetical protein
MRRVDCAGLYLKILKVRVFWLSPRPGHSLSSLVFINHSCFCVRFDETRKRFLYCGGIQSIAQCLYSCKIVSILLGSVSAVGMTSDYELWGIRFKSRCGQKCQLLPDFRIWVKTVISGKSVFSRIFESEQKWTFRSFWTFGLFVRFFKKYFFFGFSKKKKKKKKKKKIFARGEGAVLRCHVLHVVSHMFYF